MHHLFWTIFGSFLDSIEHDFVTIWQPENGKEWQIHKYDTRKLLGPQRNLKRKWQRPKKSENNQKNKKINGHQRKFSLSILLGDNRSNNVLCAALKLNLLVNISSHSCGWEAVTSWLRTSYLVQKNYRKCDLTSPDIFVNCSICITLSMESW